MNIDEYQSRFPNEYVWTVTAGTPGVIEEGMLAFDESAAHFAGPFEGGFCYYRLADMRDMPGWGPLSYRCRVATATALQPPKPAPAHTVTIRTAGPK